VYPFLAIPTGAAIKTLSEEDQTIILERKKQYLAFLLHEQSRLERERMKIDKELRDLPFELEKIIKGIDEMEGRAQSEDVASESSDDDEWLSNFLAKVDLQKSKRAAGLGGVPPAV